MEQKKVKVSEYLKCLFTKKAIVKILDSEMAAMEMQISELARKFKDGYEHRDVPCERIYDYAEGKKYTTRMDNGEIIKEVMLTADELLPMGLDA